MRRVRPGGGSLITFQSIILYYLKNFYHFMKNDDHELPGCFIKKYYFISEYYVSMNGALFRGEVRGD